MNDQILKIECARCAEMRGELADLREAVALLRIYNESAWVGVGGFDARAHAEKRRCALLEKYKDDEGALDSPHA